MACLAQSIWYSKVSLTLLARTVGGKQQPSVPESKGLLELGRLGALLRETVMRFCIAFCLCAVSLYPSSALPQDIISVPLRDKSAAGAPFQVDGKLTLVESVQANELEWSWGEKVAVKNLSDKEILLFVVTIAEGGRHPAPVGRRTAPGDGSTYRLEDDRFFNEKLIKPGESLILRDTKPGVLDVVCCVDPLVESHDPSAEYRLQFVQFSDGSIFGDAAAARDSLAIRKIILCGLRELLETYDRAGEPGFAARVKSLRSDLMNPGFVPNEHEQPPFFATAICRQIIAKYDSAGTRAALNETREIVRTAEKHSALMAPGPPL